MTTSRRSPRAHGRVEIVGARACGRSVRAIEAWGRVLLELSIETRHAHSRSALCAQIRTAGEGRGWIDSELFTRVEPVAWGRVDASTYEVMLIRRRRRSQFDQRFAELKVDPASGVQGLQRAVSRYGGADVKFAQFDAGWVRRDWSKARTRVRNGCSVSL
jgi:hypothetical protein